jgi:S-adenosylmethionine/arginine decarboxylase-like enzyme
MSNIEVKSNRAQPRVPFTAVRLAMLYECECPREWLEGSCALEMMHRLEELSAQSGFTVIAKHLDLYGSNWAEKSRYGWTVNLTLAQSGIAVDAWTEQRTIDINLHWCDENPPSEGASLCQSAEETLIQGLVLLFRPKIGKPEDNVRLYRTISRER